MRLIPFILFCVVSFALAFALVNKNEPNQTGGTSNEPLPALSIVAFEGGRKWDANALKGQVTLINFFASWCTPCAAEMPELVALKQQFPALAMNGVVWNDQPEPLKQFLDRNGNPFAHLWLDEGGKASISLGIRGIPETFVVDAHGVIRYRLAAPVTQELRVGELGALIAELMKEKSDAQ